MAARDAPADYPAVLARLKRRITAAQNRAVRSMSRELVNLYWHIGKTIAGRQAKAGWGSAVVERLAHDLRVAFQDLEGFSPRNVWRMRAFYLAWAAEPKKLTQAVSGSGGGLPREKLPQAVSEIPWGHNIVLLQQLKRPTERLWYAERACEEGWSRAFLQAQIAREAYRRQGKATTNFATVLTQPHAEKAHQALKDPYTFDFLTAGRRANERVTERELLAHVREFLLELGAGFAFIGNQVKLTVGDEDYFLDLLFYHVRLRCYVVVELKATVFKPEHVGKMNFYLSAVDDLLRHPEDQPSIGLLLCRSRNRLRVEYALRDIRKPIGVAQWETRLVEALPESFQGSLPTVEELEAELSRGDVNS